VASKLIRCHRHFELKLDLKCKARYVAGGHMTNPPTSLAYSSMVARDSIQLAFLIEAVNDLQIVTTGIGNAYLNATTKENVHTIFGAEFGKRVIGRTVVIHKALYGLKTSGAAWRSMFEVTLADLQFKSSLLHPDVWLREATKPSKGEIL